MLHFHTYITVPYSTEMQCITLYTDHTYSTIPFRYVTLHDITLHYIVFCIASHCIASHYLPIYLPTYLSIYLSIYLYCTTTTWNSITIWHSITFHVTWLFLIHIEFKTSRAWRVRPLPVWFPWPSLKCYIATWGRYHVSRSLELKVDSPIPIQCQTIIPWVLELYTHYSLKNHYDYPFQYVGTTMITHSNYIP